MVQRRPSLSRPRRTTLDPVEPGEGVLSNVIEGGDGRVARAGGARFVQPVRATITVNSTRIFPVLRVSPITALRGYSFGGVGK